MASEVHTVPIDEARKWAKDAYHEGKAAGYKEAVKSLEQSVEQLVRLGVQAQRK